MKEKGESEFGSVNGRRSGGLRARVKQGMPGCKTSSTPKEVKLIFAQVWVFIKYVWDR